MELLREHTKEALRTIRGVGRQGARNSAAIWPIDEKKV
jgi:hypothetical protein